MDYRKDLPEAISFVPTEKLAESFKLDYTDMCGSFIYEENPLSFDALLDKMTALQEEFRKVLI